MRKRRNDKSHRKKHKIKKQDSGNNGNKEPYWIKTKRGSFKVLLDPNLVIKPGPFIRFCSIGGKEKIYPRNQISITRIK